MNDQTGTLIGDADVDAFTRDGVVCIRGLLDAAWIERMIGAIDRIEHKPGPFRERYNPDCSGMFFSEKFMWTFDPDFRAGLTADHHAREEMHLSTESFHGNCYAVTGDGAKGIRYLYAVDS